LLLEDAGPWPPLERVLVEEGPLGFDLAGQGGVEDEHEHADAVVEGMLVGEANERLPGVGVAPGIDKGQDPEADLAAGVTSEGLDDGHGRLLGVEHDLGYVAPEAGDLSGEDVVGPPHLSRGGGTIVGSTVEGDGRGSTLDERPVGGGGGDRERLPLGALARGGGGLRGGGLRRGWGLGGANSARPGKTAVVVGGCDEVRQAGGMTLAQGLELETIMRKRGVSIALGAIVGSGERRCSFPFIGEMRGSTDDG
jgi:hypothetical protein